MAFNRAEWLRKKEEAKKGLAMAHQLNAVREVVRSWSDVANLINRYAPGGSQIIGTFELELLGAGLARLKVTVDLMPGPVPQLTEQTYKPSDDDIPF